MLGEIVSAMGSEQHLWFPEQRKWAPDQRLWALKQCLRRGGRGQFALVFTACPKALAAHEWALGHALQNQQHPAT